MMEEITKMAYTRGNLAVQEKSTERVSPRYREKTKVITRRTYLPVKEKLLYLMTVVVCVAMAIVVIGRYAHIYDLNKQNQVASQQIKQMNVKLMELELERQMLEVSLPTKARELGYVEPAEDSTIYVPRVTSGSTSITESHTDTAQK